MTCRFPREQLALFAEGDLAGSQVDEVSQHVMDCPPCAEFLRALQEKQQLLKSLRYDTPTPAMLDSVRHGVMSRIEDGSAHSGWATRLERAVLIGFRKQRYAVAGLAILAIVSASLLGQIQRGEKHLEKPAAMFEDGNTMLRPEGYREWVFVGSSIGLNYSQNPEAPHTKLFHNVYIDPAAYKEYSRSGVFPEGTVMVLELANPEVKSEPGLQGSYEGNFVALEASVKDSSRFAGGWGYFGFTDPDGNLRDKAQALPESAGCRGCHEARAQTDHVFTQFYPVLRAISAKL